MNRILSALIFSVLTVAAPLAVAADTAPGTPQVPENVVVQDIPGTTVSFGLVTVPGGKMTIPDPDDPTAVKQAVLKPFLIGRMEVTWDEYDAYMLDKDTDAGNQGADAVSRPSKPYGAPDRGFGHRGYPVISITSHAAQQYCRWLSAKTGKKFRLPTEDEWEHAARATQPDLTPEQLKEQAWFWQEKTQAVGKMKPNAWGIHDMLGNVGEWCVDRKGKPVLCGGAYDDMAKSVTPSARKYQQPSWNITDPQNPKSTWWLSDGPFAGFRVLQEIP